MTEESRRRGRPPKALTGAETVSGEWEHPPWQDHMEEVDSPPENPIVGVAEEMPKESLPDLQSSEKLDIPTPAYVGEFIAANIPPGYQTMDSAPEDGTKIVVSENGQDQCCVYWRERRVVDRKNLRYIKKGAWTNDFTRLDIDFEPKFWRPYVSSDYFPVARVK